MLLRWLCRGRLPGNVFLCQSYHRPACFFSLLFPCGFPVISPENLLLSSPFCQTCSSGSFCFASIAPKRQRLGSNFLITRNLLLIESKNNSPHGTILSVPYGYPSPTSVENTGFCIWSCLVLSNKCLRASFAGIIRGRSFSGRSEIAVTVFPMEECNKKKRSMQPAHLPFA